MDVRYSAHEANYTMCLRKKCTNFETVGPYSSKFYGSILITFGRNIQNALQ